MWKMISRKQVYGLKFRRQHSIGPYIIDFYCPEIKLAIELDGAVHTTFHGMERDLKRDKYLELQGIQVLHIENRYVFDFPEDIIEAITKIYKTINTELI